MRPFRVIGYYICETTNAPAWLGGAADRVLSVSGCIGEQHPKRECFMGGFRKGQRREYQTILGMDDQRYKEFSDAAGRLFIQGEMDIDSRFSRLSDARDFYQNFCSGTSWRIVSVSTSPEHFVALAEELAGGHCPMSGEADQSLPLGGDILG